MPQLKIGIQYPLDMELDAHKVFALQCNDVTLPCARQ